MVLVVHDFVLVVIAKLPVVFHGGCRGLAVPLAASCAHSLSGFGELGPRFWLSRRSAIIDNAVHV